MLVIVICHSVDDDDAEARLLGQHHHVLSEAAHEHSHLHVSVSGAWGIIIAAHAFAGRSCSRHWLSTAVCSDMCHLLKHQSITHHSTGKR